MSDKIFDEIKLDGCIDVSENRVSIDQFLDLFIEWVESNNWTYGGDTNPLYIEEEEKEN